MTDIRNPISGTVKAVPLDQLLAMADEDIRERLTSMLAQSHVSGLMCYEVLQMDSSQFGHRHFMIYGPGCTYRTAADAANGRLGDVPSRFAYPVAYYEKKG